MGQDEILREIDTNFHTEDPILIKVNTRNIIDKLLLMNDIPSTHSTFIEFIKFSVEVMSPEIKSLIELIKKAKFTKEQIENNDLKNTLSKIAKINSNEGQELFRLYFEDEPPRKRRKVTWGDDLIQVKEIPRVEMDPSIDYTYNPFVNKPEGEKLIKKNRDWIVPAKLDSNSMPKSKEMLVQKNREGESVKMWNLEEHRRFAPSPCLDTGKECKTEVLPLINLNRKNYIPNFDIKKIVEDAESFKMDINQILADPTVIDALFLNN